MERLHIEHIPQSHQVYAALFRGIDNASFIQSQLIARNADFEYAFIDAASIGSRRQVLSAIFKALMTLLDGSLVTPNVHSEIVCSLAPSNNIAEAYRRYGITPQTHDVIVIKVLSLADPVAENSGVEKVREHVKSFIKSDPLPLTDENITQCAEWDKIRKYYKLNSKVATTKIGEGASREDAELMILGAMALRGV